MVAVSLKKNFFKQKTAYEMIEGDWSSDVCSSDLVRRGSLRAVLPVWHSGLAEWTTAERVPELSYMLPEETTQTEETTQIIEVETIVKSPADDSNTPAETAADTSTAAESTSQTSGSRRPQPYSGTWISESTASQPQSQRPASYLTWNILATICCCIPVGIIGIIYSSKVNRYYMEGNEEGARRASETAAWCLIIAFTLGLVSWPFQMLFSGL